ncbi:MAG: cell wall hydrolase [Sphingomicrobium sp.]
MTKLLGAGGSSVLAAALLLTVGGSSEASAQVWALPQVTKAVATVTTAVVKSTVQALTPAPTLDTLVESAVAGAALDVEGQCLATAVYFESMGEPLKGQLAVANVVINRARSGRYPTSFCGVVKQKAQFSFVRNGRFPRINTACQAWRKAQAIARIATANTMAALPTDVLWYHADYVAPRWRNNLVKVDKIGAHIFYRG